MKHPSNFEEARVVIQEFDACNDSESPDVIIPIDRIISSNGENILSTVEYGSNDDTVVVKSIYFDLDEKSEYGSPLPINYTEISFTEFERIYKTILATREALIK